MGNISASAPKSAGVKAERKIVVEKASIMRKRSSTGSNSSRCQSSSGHQQQEQLNKQVEQLIVGRRPVGRSASSTRPSPARKGSSASSRSAAVTGRPSFSSRRPSKEWKTGGGSARAEVLAPSQRDIVRHCFESAHADIGRRVNLRLQEKRIDFREFVTSLGVEAWAESSVALTNMLEAAAAGVENSAEVTRVGAELGEFYAAIKSQGFNFKPDYWVTMADAMVVECVYLDHAQHSTTDVTEAWSQLLSMLFSSARDAYYAKLRLIRQNSRRPSMIRQASTIITEAVEQHQGSIRKSTSKTPPPAHHLEEPVTNGVGKTSNKGGKMEETIDTMIKNS